jgi:predicted AlkP superfamily phosphohydrolase/phosphomutase
MSTICSIRSIRCGCFLFGVRSHRCSSTFIGGCVILLLSLLLPACARPAAPATKHRVLVLGFDGLDPILLDRFMAEGVLPNFARLAHEGSYHHLATTIPPQSPVAWSTIITGLDPGGHGIFDFVHRNPAPPDGGAVEPFLSTSRVSEDELRVPLGPYALPLRSGKAELLRHGTAFWNLLVAQGVPATVVKIPANFPPEPSAAQTLSDMGTPDIRGTYGTFSFYTSDPAEAGRTVSGGIFHNVTLRDDHVRAELPGPVNPFRRGEERASCPFDVYVDPERDAVKIEVDGQELLLQRGEWSPWVAVSFPLFAGVATVHGEVRFQLQGVHPHLRLYTTPINMSPADPALPISTPPEFARQLYEDLGLFYTQGLPESTAALTADALDDGEWIAQANDIYGERHRLFERQLRRFRRGVLFVYFGGPDQVSHMFWRTLDHADNPYRNAIRHTYRQVDTVLGEALAAVDGDMTLIVLSDHGFAPWSRSVDLNGWLHSQGYLALQPGVTQGHELFADGDWTRTRAYGLGLNGLYLNMAGRERFGVVAAADRARLQAEISERLLQWRDPQNGAAVVERVYRPEAVYSGPYRELAPDLIVGYARGYRVSNESALGAAGEALVEDNHHKWSGDHCMAANAVPGVLLSNRPVVSNDVGLADIAPTLLGEFGITPPKEMVGKSFLARQ